MASPSWFFSTLAQAAAASIGFVIAFSAALYTSRRSRQRERISEFQRDIRDYLEQTEGPIEEMEERLRITTNFEMNYGIYSEGDSASSISQGIREWANNQPDPSAAFLWANLQWMTSLLYSIQTDTSPDSMANNMDALETPVLNVYTSFDNVPKPEGREGEPLSFELLYQEVTEGMDGPPDDYSDTYHIFGTLPQLNNYLDERNVTASTGATMEGWTAAAEEIKDGFYQIHNLQYFDTDLFNNNVVGPVLKTCRTLFLVSVILPTLFLLTIPELSFYPSLPEYVVTLTEINVLILTAYFGYNLFSDLIDLVGQTEF